MKFELQKESLGFNLITIAYKKNVWSVPDIIFVSGYVILVLYGIGVEGGEMIKKVCCNNCQKAVRIKDWYLNSFGILELILYCGCRLLLKIERIKQDKEMHHDKEK